MCDRLDGEHHFAPSPGAVYGVVLFMAGVAYTILLPSLIDSHGRDSKIATRVGTNLKGKISIALYLAAIPQAFVSAWISLSVYLAIAMIWFIPDRRFEKTSDAL